MAQGWKRVAEAIIAGAGAHRVRLRTIHPSAIILAYHNILPQGESLAGEASLHLAQDDFGRQLDALLETHDVVPLDRIFEISDHDRPRASITFDDAYTGALTAGLDELERRGLSSTIMVAPGILARPCWWDRLARPDDGILPPRVRHYCLTVLRGELERVEVWARGAGMPLQHLPDYAIPASEGEVHAAGARPGVFLGVHTWGHPNLAALTPQEVWTEMERARVWVLARAASFSDWLAYPYGLVSPAATEAAGRIFRGALLVNGGLAVRRGNGPEVASRVPRLNVPRGLTIHGLRLRAAGALGA